MDLMTLAAKIVLDDQGFTKGVSGAEKAGQKLAVKMSAMAVAVGTLAADMVKRGVGAINNVISGAVDGYADYQQLIGGVETLFKGSAGKVANYAKQSFKTTGLSANEYMETVTSFSASLLQGLKGDTSQAADMANMAVTDMADNANKMGTDIASIQTAYQGFAKQNYTMLDNLKLGYGGTREEMIRLINDSGILNKEIKSLDGITFDQIVQAIHKVQTEMGITGTTAKEAAETISGSKASLEASWADFLATVGGETDQAKIEAAAENFKSAFNTYVVNNLAPAIENTMKNAPELITAVKEAITSLPASAISELASSGIDILTSGVNAVTEIGGWLVDGLIGLFKDINADPSKIADLGNAVGEFIGSALADIVTSAPTIISGLYTAGVSLAGSLIEGLFDGMFGNGSDTLQGIYKDADKEMERSLKDAEQSSTRAQGIVEYMQGLVDKYGQLATETEEWKAALQSLDEELPGVEEWAESQTASINGVIETLNLWIQRRKEALVEEAKEKALKTKQDALTDAMGRYWEAQTNIEIQKGIRDKAAGNLLDFFGLQGAVNRETGEAIDQTFDPKATSDQIYASLMSRLAETTGGPGNQAYEDIMSKLGDTENKAQVMAWIDAMSQSNTAISDLEGSLASLKSQMDAAQADFALAASALETVAGAAADAAGALGSIHAPASGSTDMNGGEYANWYYGGGNGAGHATGLDYVPFDRYRAELHRGEAVLQRSDADKYRNGGNADVVGAIRNLGDDLRNMELVVGKKTFGRAVVNYGGNRIRGSIGRAESRHSSGYGT